MSHINCIVIDDEPLQLHVIEDYIKQVGFLNRMGSFTNPGDALSFFSHDEIDLVFLDIQMPELTGFQLIEILKDKAEFVLITAYDQYAISGYEYDVIDYLMKPVSFERFYKAAFKAREVICRKRASVYGSSKAESALQDNSVFIKTATTLLKVNLSDICYIEGLRDYVSVVTAQSKITTLQSMALLEERLKNHNFIRVHKSYIIAIDKINSIEKDHIVINDTPIPIGKHYKDNFLSEVEKRRM